MVTATQFLRANTHAAHVALEQTPLASDLMCPQLTTARYVEILAAWAAAWTALESCIWASPVAQEVAELLPARCAHLAQDDLQYWREQGCCVPDDPRHISDPWVALRPSQTADLLGVCYVARGASLGSQVIAAQLQKTLHLGPGRGVSFFARQPAGEAAPMTWPQWSARLEARLNTPEALALAVVWANATFAALHDSFVRAHHAQPATA